MNKVYPHSIPILLYKNWVLLGVLFLRILNFTLTTRVIQLLFYRYVLLLQWYIMLRNVLFMHQSSINCPIYIDNNYITKQKVFNTSAIRPLRCLRNC